MSENTISSTRLLANQIQVALVIRRIPHYRLPFYQHLIERNHHLKIVIFFGTPEADSGGSGLVQQSEHAFAKQLESFQIGPVIFQRGLLRHGVVGKFDVVIFEGGARLATSFPILLFRKLKRRKSIIWLKGWPEETKKSLGAKYLIKKLLLHLADAYIVYGHESLKSLRLYGVDESKITVIQNTVDVADLLAKYYEGAADCVQNAEIRALIASGKPYIFTIGRIIPSKRVDDLFEAFQALKADGFDDVRLVIAGDGPGFDALMARASALRSAKTHVLGKISEIDAKILYANSLFCVFPGAVGLSLNEAMAAGKAVICADEPGPDTELLVHEWNGLRFRRGDIDALAASMRALLDSNALRQHLGGRAQETIRSKATLENMVNRFSTAVTGVLSDDRSKI